MSTMALHHSPLLLPAGSKPRPGLQFHPRPFQAWHHSMGAQTLHVSFPLYPVMPQITTGTYGNRRQP